MTNKLFGTDGIRGVVNEYPITAEVALELGKAFATFSERGKIIIGRDTRDSGNMLEDAFIAGLTSVGADVLPVGVIPSNGISHLIQANKCSGGVMISASHNPSNENGFKFFSSDGFKLSETAEQKLENIFSSKKFTTAKNPGSVFRVRDAKQNYIEMIVNSLKGNNLEGLEIGVDAGNGSASDYVKEIFSQLKADATIINNDPDGNNINENCGALHTQPLQKLVGEKKLDVGVAFDGDADRLVMVDEKGNKVGGDELLAILAVNLHKKARLKKNTLVVTEYSNSGLDDSLKELGVNVVRTNPGDKNVSKELFDNDYSVGGETSGHMIISEFSKTADALIAAIQILNIIKESGKKLSELASVVKKYPLTLINVPVKEKKAIGNMPSVFAVIKESKSQLDKGRIFVRYSGTEKKMRILVEAESEEAANNFANEIAEAVKAEVGE